MLYGWAKGAPAMHLPPGVGFRVGQGTGTQVLVLQVTTTGLCKPHHLAACCPTTFGSSQARGSAPSPGRVSAQSAKPSISDHHCPFT